MSEISIAVEDYLSTRRALGYKLVFAASVLHAFAAFLEARNAAYITVALALEWARMPADVLPSQWASRLGVIRRFARYHRASDPRTEIPSAGLLPFRYMRKAPYIYSDCEVAALSTAARELSCRYGIRPRTYSTLITLLAVTGLRVGEALRLDRRDCDLKEAILFIRETKFRKSRLIPIQRSTAEALELYSAVTAELFPHVWSLFVSARGKRLSQKVAGENFRSLLARIGLPAAGDPRRPCLHGLRHRFAVSTLLGWYRKGVDIERALPLLATYLGHTNITNTYWYLSATPELLALAAERLEGPVWRMRS
jgi:integrase/recombinase XerD